MPQTDISPAFTFSVIASFISLIIIIFLRLWHVERRVKRNAVIAHKNFWKAKLLRCTELSHLFVLSDNIENCICEHYKVVPQRVVDDIFAPVVNLMFKKFKELTKKELDKL